MGDANPYRNSKRKRAPINDPRMKEHYLGSFQAKIILGNVPNITSEQKLGCSKETKRTLLGEAEEKENNIDSMKEITRPNVCWRDVVVNIVGRAESLCLLRHEFSELWRVPIYCGFIELDIEVLEERCSNEFYDKIQRNLNDNEDIESKYVSDDQSSDSSQFQSNNEKQNKSKNMSNKIIAFRKAMGHLKREEQTQVNCVVHAKLKPHLFSFPLVIPEQHYKKQKAVNGFTGLPINRQMDLLAKDSLYLIFSLMQIPSKNKKYCREQLLDKIPFMAMLFLKLLEQQQDKYQIQRNPIVLFGEKQLDKVSDVQLLKNEEFLMEVIKTDSVQQAKDDESNGNSNGEDEYDDSKEDELIYQNQEEDVDSPQDQGDVEEGRFFTKMDTPGQMKKSFQLKEYQKQGLAWMLFREQRISKKLLLRGCDLSEAAKASQFEEFILSQNSNNFFFNPFTGTACLNLEIEEEKDPCKGGILCDQMGLGKTIMTIALILQGKYKDYLNEEKPQEVNSKENLSSLSSVSRYAFNTSKFYLKAPKEPEVEKTLIVVPKSLVKQWEKEIKSCLTQEHLLQIYLYEKTSPFYELKPLFAHKDIVITTYGILAQEFKQIKKGKAEKGYLFNEKWLRIILDEAHIIRNRRTLISQACCSLKANFSWCLTGTPLQNRLDDLFSYFKLLKLPLVSEWAWWNANISTKLMKEETNMFIKAVLNGVMLRRTKSSRDSQGRPILKLPKKELIVEQIGFNQLEGDLYTSFFLNQKELFQTILSNYEKQKNEKQFRSKVLVMINSLRMMCNNFQMVKIFQNCSKKRLLQILEELQNMDPSPERNFLKEQNEIEVLEDNQDEKNIEEEINDQTENIQIDEDIQLSKTERIIQIIENLITKHEKVVLFTQWHDSINRFQLIFKKKNIDFSVLHGKMPIKERANSLKEFSEMTSKSVLILSLMAGCVGLNLTCANNVILMDPWWNSSVEGRIQFNPTFLIFIFIKSEQAIDRIYRIGQKKDIRVYKCLIDHPNSIDQKILQLTQKKSEMIFNVLDSGSSRVTAPAQSLTVEDIKFLFGFDTTIPPPPKEKTPQNNKEPKRSLDHPQQERFSDSDKSYQPKKSMEPPQKEKFPDFNRSYESKKSLEPPQKEKFPDFNRSSEPKKSQDQPPQMNKRLIKITSNNNDFPTFDQREGTFKSFSPSEYQDKANFQEDSFFESTNQVIKPHIDPKKVQEYSKRDNTFKTMSYQEEQDEEDQAFLNFITPSISKRLPPNIRSDY